jgi:hypothetical protein
MDIIAFRRDGTARLAILELINPRQHTPWFIGTFALGVLVGGAAVVLQSIPLWGAVGGVLLALLAPAIPKWRDDQRRYGTTAMLLCILLFAQGFHFVEHIAQWVQYHLLGWELRAAVGLLSPANAEWVHFIWNWTVLVAVAAFIASGARNRWAWLLLLWASAHTFEHTYLFVRHLQVLDDLRRMGVSGVTAQGLPGIFGQDGWLERSPITQGTFLCTLPGFTTAPRLDVHFWWNIGETALMIPAANTYMAHLLRTEPTPTHAG